MTKEIIKNMTLYDVELEDHAEYIIIRLLRRKYKPRFAEIRVAKSALRECGYEMALCRNVVKKLESSLERWDKR